MGEPVHAFSIADYNRHHIRIGIARINAEAVKLLAKVIRIFPKPLSQFRSCGSELERLGNSRDHHRGQRARVNIRMRIETQVLQSLARAGDESSERAECL